MNLGEKFRKKLQEVLKTYEKRIKLENHNVPDTPYYRICCYNQVDSGFELYPLDVFELPNNMSKEDAFKVLSYYFDLLEKDSSNLEKSIYLNKLLNIPENMFRVNHSQLLKSKDVTDLFVINNGKSEFKNTEYYSKYFEWYTPNVTHEEVKGIFSKYNIPFDGVTMPEQKDEQVNKIIEDFVVNNIGDSFVWEQLPLLYSLNNMIGYSLSSFAIEKNDEVNWNELQRYTPFELVDLVQKFYDDHGIDLDANKLLQDGVIDFEYHELSPEEMNNGKVFIYDYANGSSKMSVDLVDFFDTHLSFDDDETLNSAQYGTAYSFEGDDRLSYFPIFQKRVNVKNNGHFSNVFILLHELAHFKNQHYIVSENRNALTEVLSTAEELVAEEYFKEHGFQNDCNAHQRIMLGHYYDQAEELYPIYKMLMLYKSMGKVSKENYEKMFEDSNYYRILEYVKNIDRYKNLEEVAGYTLAYGIAPYLLSQYKINPKFMDIIQTLHKSINKLSFEECLNIMGIDNPEDISKLEEALIDLRDSSLGNNKTKTH